MIDNFTADYKYIKGVNGNILKKHKYSDRVLPFSVAVTVEKGVFFVEIEGVRYNIFENETIFIPSFVPHSVGMDDDGVVTYAHFVCSYLNVDILSFSKVDHLIIKNNDICNLIKEMNNSASSGGLIGKIGVDKSISEIILTLLRQQVLTLELPTVDLWLFKVLNFIKQNTNQAITVDEVIALSGYSKTAFHQMFTNTMNLSPHQYIEQERLKKAIFSLSEGKKVKEAAKSAGYSDEIYFSKKFKKVFGITPSKYRKNISEQWRDI